MRAYSSKVAATVHSASSAGVRRIEALTGTEALAWLREQEAVLEVGAAHGRLGARLARHRGHVQVEDREVAVQRDDAAPLAVELAHLLRRQPLSQVLKHNVVPVSYTHLTLPTKA